MYLQNTTYSQGAEFFSNCFWQSANNRIVVRIALSNPTGSSSGQMKLVGMRFGFQYNADQVNYTGYTSYMTTLNDPTHLGFIGPDTNPSPAVDIDVPSSRSAYISSTGSNKTMQRRYINRSTSICNNAIVINSGNTVILLDIYFQLVSRPPGFYHLTNSLYGFNDTEFIAQLLDKWSIPNNDPHNANLINDYKDIAIIVFRIANSQSPYQPFDASGCTNGNFNPISIGKEDANFISPINGVLSGKVESLTAAEKNNNIQLDWKVENNELVDHYELERKDENGEFKTIAMIMSDNKYSTTSYQYTDKITAREQQLYYRVKTVGLDQVITYSDVKTIKLRSVQQPNIKVYPNPSSDVIRIDLPIANGAYVCRFYNSEGRMVKVENMSFPNSSIQVNTLVNGNYFVELYHPQSGKRFYSQFTKQ